MQKEVLLNVLIQNQMTNSFAFDKISNENADFRLSETSNSVGFIYRHIGETINLFGTFFGVPTDIQNTTMGRTDEGQGRNIEESRNQIAKGYQMLQTLIEDKPDAEWLENIETPFFGTVSKIRLFMHILFHNSHHAGQISLTLSKVKKW
jgi:uncharacterized damage-inducible protein DinB